MNNLFCKARQSLVNICETGDLLFNGTHHSINQPLNHYDLVDKEIKIIVTSSDLTHLKVYIEFSLP